MIKLLTSLLPDELESNTEFRYQATRCLECGERVLERRVAKNPWPKRLLCCVCLRNACSVRLH